jgi:hypothetical protein
LTLSLAQAASDNKIVKIKIFFMSLPGRGKVDVTRQSTFSRSFSRSWIFRVYGAPEFALLFNARRRLRGNRMEFACRRRPDIRIQLSKHGEAKLSHSCVAHGVGYFCKMAKGHRTLGDRVFIDKGIGEIIQIVMVIVGHCGSLEKAGR